MPRIAVVRLWFEGNFFPPTARQVGASVAQLGRGAGQARALAGTATELGGLAAFLEARRHWHAALLRSASAQPGGPLTRAASADWLNEVLAGLAAGGPWDGAYLSLHGACVAAHEPTPDLAIARAVRAAIGGTPLVASFDFHGNMAPELATLLNGACVYRTYPHLDLAETPQRALVLLEHCMAGGALHGAIVKLPHVLHSFHMRSAEGTITEVWAEAVALPGPEAALALALAAPPRLVVLLDPADNPLSSGLADTPGLLRVLLTAALPVPTVFACLQDPMTVAKARAVGQGARARFALGARSTGVFGPPVSWGSDVERQTEGRFTNTGPMENGTLVDLGPSFVLRAGWLRVIVVSRREATVDPTFFAAWH